MEKRSRRRTRDLVTQPASQGLSENENGCVRISMMAKSMNALFTGRIQKRKTQSPPSLTSGLQHTAGQDRVYFPPMGHVWTAPAVQEESDV